MTIVRANTRPRLQAPKPVYPAGNPGPRLAPRSHVAPLVKAPTAHGRGPVTARFCNVRSVGVVGRMVRPIKNRNHIYATEAKRPARRIRHRPLRPRQVVLCWSDDVRHRSAPEPGFPNPAAGLLQALPRHTPQPQALVPGTTANFVPPVIVMSGAPAAKTAFDHLNATLTDALSK
jgi:hypothetical protein